MGKLDLGLFDGFRGKINGVSVYKMKGVDKLIVRKSGGHSKEKQKRDDKLDLFCRAGTEFGGRSALTGYLKWALRLHKFCMDPNVTGRLNAVLKPVQDLDHISERGHRNIYLSQHKEYLKGFSLSKGQPFDSVVTFSPQCTIDRANLTARIQIPAMIPGVNFHTQDKSPYYQFIVTMTAVPDVTWQAVRFAPVYNHELIFGDAEDRTDWFSLLEGSPAVDLTLRSDIAPPTEQYTLVVTIGICYGILKTLDEVEMKPYGGSGKIIEVG